MPLLCLPYPTPARSSLSAPFCLFSGVFVRFPAHPSAAEPSAECRDNLGRSSARAAPLLHDDGCSEQQQQQQQQQRRQQQAAVAAARPPPALLPRARPWVPRRRRRCRRGRRWRAATPCGPHVWRWVSGALGECAWGVPVVMHLHSVKKLENQRVVLASGLG